jgi:hypothetical protein
MNIFALSCHIARRSGVKLEKAPLAARRALFTTQNSEVYA